jgi:hypothetical protein
MNSLQLFIMFIFLLLIITGLFLIVPHNSSIESFDNLEFNLYSYDTCCFQKEIDNCEKYGKTGVCNYNENNKSCLCQNSF